MMPEGVEFPARTAPLAPAPPRAPTATPRSGTRIDTVDLLRGLVIALMVLDHVRDFFHETAFVFQPTDLGRTSVVLFMTRWITHLCAPTFVLLAGVGARLQRDDAVARGAGTGGVARFLLTRGLWLLVLEVTLVGFALDFAPFLFLQVIWAIGVSMALLALLLRLPPGAVLALGAAIVAGHDAFAAVNAAGGAAGATLWRLAMEPGPVPGGFVAYPLLPWAGVMLAGYGLGHLFAAEPGRRTRTLLRLAAGMLAAFALLRLANLYGDPRPWSVQPRGAAYTVLSFIDVSKYPPSLQYVLLTLGTAIPLGLAVERWRGAGGALVNRVLVAFGRTPMLTYLVHLFLVHGLALALGVATGYDAGIFVRMISDPTRVLAAKWGIGLAATYGVWLLVLALLYPLSRWYAEQRRRRRAWWMRYL